MRKSLKLTCLIGVILIATGAFSSMPVQAQYIPRATLIFEEYSTLIESAPGTSRIATFNGSMESSCETTYTIELCIESAIPSGWTIAVSPAMVRHTAGTHTDDISVVVMAPPEASEKETFTIKIQTYTSRIEAGLRYYGPSATLSVKVKPYYRLAIACPAPYQEIAPGKEITFTLDITNLGNTYDYFKFEILNRDELTGWVLPAETTIVDVSEKDTGPLLIKLVAPRDWTLWRDDVVRVDIKVLSKTSQEREPEPVYETFYLYLRQRGTYIPGFEPMLLIIAFILVAIVTKKNLFIK